jgi:hypothetical protein
MVLLRSMIYRLIRWSNGKSGLRHKNRMTPIAEATTGDNPGSLPPLADFSSSRALSEAQAALTALNTARAAARVALVAEQHCRLQIELYGF